VKTPLCAWLVLSAVAGLPLGAQSVVPARAGLVYYSEGRIVLNDHVLQRGFGEFPQMKKGDVFLTGRGRAEILLAPDIFLRLGERASIRLVSDRIMHAAIDLVTGRAILEAASLRKTQTVILKCGDATVSISKRGLYRLETNPARLEVFKGKAVVTSGNRRIEVGQGRALLFGEAWTTREFDRHQADALEMWSSRRSRQFALAHAAALRASAPLDDGDFSAATSAHVGRHR
jgi:hypothetical protein